MTATNNTLAEALERLGKIAEGCALTTVYGPEWTIFPDVEMRKDLRQALATLRASTDAAAVGATRTWANKMANMRQGQSSTPQCEPPSEYQIERAMDQIKEVLAASPPLYAHPPVADAAVAGEDLDRAVKMAHDTMAMGDDGSDGNLHRAHVHAAWVIRLAALSNPAPAEPVGLREAIKTLELIRDTDAPASFLREAAATTLSTLTRTDEALPERLHGVEGIGASFNRDDDSWHFYTMPDIMPLSIVVKGYNRGLLDWVINSLRAALSRTDEAQS